jgi:hypothetical protein
MKVSQALHLSRLTTRATTHVLLIPTFILDRYDIIPYCTQYLAHLLYVVVHVDSATWNCYTTREAYNKTL